jgi:hypothetical protein
VVVAGAGVRDALSSEALYRPRHPLVLLPAVPELAVETVTPGVCATVVGVGAAWAAEQAVGLLFRRALFLSEAEGS